MDITTSTSLERWEYTKHYLHTMDKVDTDYNTYPESWIAPAPSKFDRMLCGCGCDELVMGFCTYNVGHDQKHYGKLIRQFASGSLAEKLQIVTDARSIATDGVYAKFASRFNLRMLRAADVDGTSRYVHVYAAVGLVVKVGRWYYPVVQGLDGKCYRSTKTIQGTFDADHTFGIEVAADDVTNIERVWRAAREEEEAAAA